MKTFKATTTSSDYVIKSCICPNLTYRLILGFYEGYYYVNYIHGIKSFKRFFRQLNNAEQSYKSCIKQIA